MPVLTENVRPVLQVLRRSRQVFVERCTVAVLESVPKYALVDGARLRQSVEQFIDDLLRIDEAPTGIRERAYAVAVERVNQGFSLSDFLRALVVCVPVARELVREAGPLEAPGLAQGFAELERFVYDYLAGTANVFAEHTARQLEAKNAELNRVNQRLQAHERALSAEVKHASAALEQANEFNRRVIDSLTSGLMVVGPGPAQVVSLFTSRMEEILGIPAERVLGQHVEEALRPLQGLDLRDLSASVRTLGRLPLTKVRLKLSDGQERSVHVQATQMRDEQGQNMGTVVSVDDVTERDLLVDQFSRYVSRDLVNRLLARSAPLGLAAERRICTILFADIRGFTTLAEGLTPEELHGLLNRYLRIMVDGIVAHGGFIDKFVGDKVMALFMGARDPAESAAAACRAALAIKREIRALSGERQAAGLRAVDAGIGLNTGEVLVGNVGSEARMDFTAIGDAVNVADRMQSLARGGEVLLGENTANLVRPRFALLDRGSQPVKGRAAPVHVYELPVD